MKGKAFTLYYFICVILLLGLLLIPSIVQAALVAQYHLDTDSGTTATDSSGSGNTGTISGASWVQLPSGYCLSFDGINDYVNCGNASSLNLTNTVTMVAWVCPWTSSGAEAGICGRANSASDSRYLLTYYNNNSYWFYINTGGSNNIYAGVTPGIWNQIAVTYDKNAASQNMKIYVNGVLQGYKNYTTAITSNTLNFYIGAYTNSNGQFKGLIDEVNVYNTTLTATEVANLYSSSTRDTYNGMVAFTSGNITYGVEDGQVAHYNCNEGTGTTLNDIGGYMNTGTLGSSSMWSANSSPNDGYSLSFNGTTSQKVTCGTKNGFDITGPITVMAWINPDSSQAVTDSGLVGKGTSQYMLGYHSNGGNAVRFYINSSSTYVASSAITAGQWTHVAATYDKSNIKIYINGSYVTQTAYTTAIASSASTNLMLGCTASAGTNPFKGKMDEVRIYNRALSATEITNRYNEDSASRNGMVAHYKFDESTGNKIADSSGHNNTGTLTGGTWATCNGGSALYFNGNNSDVDCGNASSLNITGPITTVAWVCPDTQLVEETGIAGKGFNSYLTSYWKNTLICSYVNSGGNYANGSTVLPGSWNLVTTSFDGTYIRVYVNGAQTAKITSQFGSISSDATHLHIGNISGSGNYFKGYIDDVKIYNRTLSDAEVAAMFSSTEQINRNSMFSVTCTPVTAVQSITSDNITVKASAHGGIEVDNGSAYFVMNGSYSYPGTTIGYNTISETGFSGESGWSPSVTKPNSTTLQITATGTKYTLNRQVKLVTRNGSTAVTVEDTLTNTSAAAVGILVDHSIITPSAMSNICYGNEASFPLIFFSQPSSDFGIIVEDDLGRIQFDPFVVANRANIYHTNFGLDVSGNYTFKYAIYPLASTGDVFDLVNRVRKDWNVNNTIQGPWRFMNVGCGQIPWNSPDDLKRWVQRRNLGVAAMSPWLDYDPDYTDHVLSRSEYQSMMQNYTAQVRSANPGIKCLGSIESDWLTIDPDNHSDNTRPMFTQSDGDAIKAYCAGTGSQAAASAAIANTVSLGNLRWRDPNTGVWYDFSDSIKREIPGQVRIEYYNRSGNLFYALSVYLKQNNGQYNFLMNQNAFLMDICELDGYYIDEFSQFWQGETVSKHSYGNAGELQWDGNSVAINPSTGQIQTADGKWVDCSYVGIPGRVNLMNAASSRSKYMTANTYSSSPEEQSLGCNRMAETWWLVDPSNLTPGVEPPFNNILFDGSLTSPIGYGICDKYGMCTDTAQGLMLGLMQFLRHGMVYYHSAFYPELPTSGTGAGEYGPINHMFPFTPQELHKGWIKGNERIVTGVSISNVSWNNSSAAPLVHFFDMHGYEIAANGTSRYANITGTPGSWNISITLNNWNEFCVVEQSDGLVARYKFDEGSGGVAIDSSGNSNTATIHNAAYVAVNGGYALSFDGAKSFVDCGNSVLFDQRGPVSMSAWVCPSTHQNGEGGIVGKNVLSYELTYWSGDGHAYWYINSGSNSTSTAIPSGSSWSLVTVTYNQTYMKIYINGVYQNQIAYNNAISAGENLLIGCRGLSGGVPSGVFKGFIDDVRIYNRCLSSTEVASLYSVSEKSTRDAIFSNGVEDGLVVHYNMDEGVGTTLTDSSGFSNTATIDGASWLNVATDNYALDFDGIKSYVDCGNGTSFDLTNPTITMIYWICPWSTQYGGSEVSVVGKGNSSYISTYWAGTYLCWYVNGGGNYTYTTVSPGSWSQVATTYDGTTLKIYVNGSLTSSQAYNASVINSGANLYLGCSGLTSGSPNLPFKGVIDDVKIYNYCMSQTEIANQFSSTERNIRNNMFSNGVADSLIAHYTLSEGSGSTIADSSGHSNDGMLNNVAWTTRRSGANALVFNGSTSYVDCGDGSSLDIMGPMTLMVWVHPDTTQPNNEPGLIGKGYDSYMLTWWYGGDKNSYFYIDNGNNYADYLIPSAAWTQITAVFDPYNSNTNMRMRLYINGVQQYAGPSAYTTVSEGGNLYIGCRGLNGTTPISPLSGRIGDLRIYNKVLSDTEITNCYNP